ncbi:MAG: GTP-binding protein [Methylococcaceae bacterium]
MQSVLLYLTTHYKLLVRLKGLVYISGQDQPLLLQEAAGKRYSPRQLPSRSCDDGIGRLVFISEGEITGLIEALLTQLWMV